MLQLRLNGRRCRCRCRRCICSPRFLRPSTYSRTRLVIARSIDYAAYTVSVLDRHLLRSLVLANKFIVCPAPSNATSRATFCDIDTNASQPTLSRGNLPRFCLEIVVRSRIQLAGETRGETGLTKRWTGSFEAGLFSFYAYARVDRMHALACRRIKDGPVRILPLRSGTGLLLPAFLMSDRKRVACVIYARDFSPVRAGPAAPCSRTFCTYRCRTDRVVSRLYR